MQLRKLVCREGREERRLRKEGEWGGGGRKRRGKEKVIDTKRNREHSTSGYRERKTREKEKQ